MDELTLYYDSEGCIWYGDGDLCADVLFDNLALGISKLDMARLFAAAPELLAACKLALDWLDDVCNPDNEEVRTMEGISVRQAIEGAIHLALINTYNGAQV